MTWSETAVGSITMETVFRTFVLCSGFRVIGEASNWALIHWFTADWLWVSKWLYQKLQLVPELWKLFFELSCYAQNFVSYKKQATGLQFTDLPRIDFGCLNDFIRNCGWFHNYGNCISNFYVMLIFLCRRRSKELGCNSLIYRGLTLGI